MDIRPRGMKFSNTFLGLFEFILKLYNFRDLHRDSFTWYMYL